ncbi:KDEL endoplasmic reticulum protein retention receptor, variant [Capsaspora owczarzaki ATCC 30864]|uniref:ER lumen protein-retaining receptor n=1 Tax=Capsaspora owczarzaki (strain ATCC 30864) TaxID=595528 RepID=A0A0D2WU19_CAPO3|nr:KDEL endoplasmic reticulum protein retention receptor, variant [Capsaspora owczarzaki ATCC 30864]
MVVPAESLIKLYDSSISLRSQGLFALVFTLRYLDLFTTYISLYNTVMKILFITSSYGTCYLIFKKFRATYDHNVDNFPLQYPLGACVILALIFNHSWDPVELLWTVSIYLESVAIMPQLWMIQKTGEAESVTSHYLFALGAYRALYLLNWVYRYFEEDHFDAIVVFAGIIQTVLYCDFFYLYITKVLRGQRLKMPI